MRPDKLEARTARPRSARRSARAGISAAGARMCKFSSLKRAFLRLRASRFVRRSRGARRVQLTRGTRRAQQRATGDSPAVEPPGASPGLNVFFVSSESCSLKSISIYMRQLGKTSSFFKFHFKASLCFLSDQTPQLFRCQQMAGVWDFNLTYITIHTHRLR